MHLDTLGNALLSYEERCYCVRARLVRCGLLEDHAFRVEICSHCAGMCTVPPVHFFFWRRRVGMGNFHPETLPSGPTAAEASGCDHIKQLYPVP